MPFQPFPEYKPDVDDFRGQHTQVLSGVLPRGDGYGPWPNLQAYAAALPAQCRGFIYARNTDGTIVIFAATADRLFKLDNTTLTWVPVSKVTALTSISNGSPGVVTKAAHGLPNGATLTLTTTGTLPAPLTTGTVYYVVNSATNTLNLALTSGGAAINTSSAGSGTHSMTYVYSSVPSTDQWQFAQFGTSVVAVQANTVPQVFTVGSSAAFSDLAGSPPTARYVTVVGRFLHLTGLVSNPTRDQWSAIDDITGWTVGTNFSNYVDLPDGGVVRGVAGGEFGLLCQESVRRRLVYQPGASPAFQIERVTEDDGLLGPYSIVRAGGRVAFISPKGVYEYVPGVGFKSIGKEKVDRTLLADIDAGYLHLLIGAADPSATRYLWAYKSVGSSSTTSFDKIIAYDYELERWAPPVSISGEYLAGMVKPGITLDGLDSVSSSVDALTFSLDSVQAALSAKIAAVDTSHRLGFFDGANVEAIMETPEQSIEGRRIRINGFMPRTDAATVYGSVRHRATPSALLSSTSETAINAHGNCPQRIETRYARARVRIPAGTSWSFCMGIEPDVTPTGTR